MDLKIKNKLALVSGSTKGIGFAIAKALAAEGARVIVNGRKESSVGEAVAAIHKSVAHAQVTGVAADLATAPGAEQLVRLYPAVDILVNNLGIYEPKPFEETTDDDWRRMFEINVLSAVRLSRLYLPGMKECDWGRVVFISSESGVQIPVEMIHYGMTKTALLAVSRGIAEACAGTGITSNAILPGPTLSEGVQEFVAKLSQGKSFQDFEKEFFGKVRPTSLARRFASPEEVASLVAYICSPLSSLTNGAALRVEGGIIKSCF